MPDPNFETVPDISFIADVVATGGGVDFVGQMTTDGKTRGARLRNDTRCVTCGRGFAKGDYAEIRLAPNWDDATFAHHGCGFPPPPIEPTGRGFGFGVRNDGAPINLSHHI
ncbi:hypothetical protein DSM43518_02008 [Mycobacterium marinum]|uniref:hypothetical protein n=1 Tax=Mycobacterium marinum TaxID=1781 RepID=UPI000CD9374C|nr:hypothetical protein [Mycobacterium marinum]AXN50921.1 hypothetical protein CCUG20998_03519 [Mycobacterium marinum]RFZ11168.1 hypothetical protein DSM43518_02008 [Mycobacterium marinum]RFZ25481.1 hypothetical protein DSM43519_01667 [Mycobacterium marinum]RFZ28368.1 hypothetical protein DSM44344_01413 [Mycobacterium marinum]RFZ33805.1 hypothetical protein NCTC2275_02651 [Mycobacterium marinum]